MALVISRENVYEKSAIAGIVGCKLDPLNDVQVQGKGIEK